MIKLLALVMDITTTKFDSTDISIKFPFPLTFQHISKSLQYTSNSSLDYCRVLSPLKTVQKFQFNSNERD